MLSTKLLFNIARRTAHQQIRQCSGLTGEIYYGKLQNKIGTREIVGWGFNGEPSYIDTSEYPFPAIRYKEVTPDIKVLKEAEKGDWKKLSKEQKKSLYRASFRQTFAEFEAPMGDWKGAVGWALIIASAAIWFYVWMKHYVYPPLPDSFKLENRLKQMENMKILQVQPFSQWWKDV